MSQIKANEFEGDSSFGRHVNIGGNADVKGHQHIHKNLKVDGWLDAKNIKGPNKGMFLNATKLREAHPRPHDGWWALVGSALPAPVYVGDGGEWVATGETGGNPTIDSELYDEAIATLQSDSAAMQQDIAAMQQDIAAIEEKDKAQDTSLTALGNDLDTVKTDVATLAETVGGLEGIRTVDVTELDGMNTRDCTLPGASAYYKVTAKEMRPSLVGTLEVFSDNMRHVVTQVLTTHYSFKDNGVLDFTAHTDAKIYQYFRSYGLNAANVPNGAWTAWAELYPEKGETAEVVRFGGSVSSANMLQMSVAAAIEGAKVWWVESAGAFGYGVEPGGIIVAPGVGLYLNWAGIPDVPDRTEFCDIVPNTARRDRLFIDDDGGVWAANSSGALVRASGGSQEDLTVEIVAGEI